MNLDRARLLLLTAPQTPVWTGTVVSYSVYTFQMTVATVSGTLPLVSTNMLLLHESGDIVRVRSHSGNTFFLAENPIPFGAGDTLALYELRLPWPRYQRIDAGTVYKDFDLAFPTPWQGELPPTAIVRARINTNPYAEAVYCATGETIALDAGDSYANLDDGDPLVFTWTPGPGGVITGSGATVTCAYSTTGFRYLLLGVADAHGSLMARYLPVWVGDGNIFAEVTACSARWDTKQGWTVDLELRGATTLLQYSPAILVDAETREVLFFGFSVPNSRVQTFEITTTRVTLQSALAFSRFLHAYPFLVTAVTGAAEPDDWAELYAPTLARALWFLMYWHSTLPQVVNWDQSGAPVRSIAGQEFTLGSLPQQADAVLKSAFWQARGCRAGGAAVVADPLYLNAANWAALTGLSLAAADLRTALDLEFALPTINQVRFGGVYRTIAGGYEPALANAPSAPGPWGSPAEVNGLAPESAAELQLWAGRHIAVENTADTYGVTPGRAVDPAVYRVADLPASIRIAIERVDLNFDPARLRWEQKIGGRTYGRTAGAAAVPLPPDIEYPNPGLPPITPPLWPPLQELENPVAVSYGGEVYFTPDALAVSPAWEDITADLPIAVVTSLVFVGAVLFAAGDAALYRCADVTNPAWVEVSVPAGYELSQNAGRRPMPQLRGAELLINIFDGDDCYAWIIDSEAETIQAPFFVGEQGVPGSTHLSWWNGGSVLSGHCPVGDDGGADVYADIWYPDPQPEEGKRSGLRYVTGQRQDAYMRLNIDPPGDGLWYYAILDGVIVLSGYNSHPTLTLELYSTMTIESNNRKTAPGGYQIYDSTTNAWVDDIELSDSVLLSPGQVGKTMLQARILVRVRHPGGLIGNASTPSMKVVATANSVYLQNLTWTGGLMFSKLGSGDDYLYIYHPLVPLGYDGNIDDVLFAACDSGTCDDETNCCALTGVLRYCPDWAESPVIKSPNAGMLGHDETNIIYTPAETPCEDEAISAATAEISDESGGRNIIQAGVYEVAVSADLTALEISDDGFATFTTATIPVGVGTANPAGALLYSGEALLIFVYGDAGVAYYNLNTDTWGDATGDLTPGDDPGAFATITAGAV